MKDIPLPVAFPSSSQSGFLGQPSEVFHMPALLAPQPRPVVPDVFTQVIKAQREEAQREALAEAAQAAEIKREIAELDEMERLARGQLLLEEEDVAPAPTPPSEEEKEPPSLFEQAVAEQAELVAEAPAYVPDRPRTLNLSKLFGEADNGGPLKVTIPAGIASKSAFAAAYLDAANQVAKKPIDPGDEKIKARIENAFQHYTAPPKARIKK